MAGHIGGHSGSTFSSQDKVRAQQANRWRRRRSCLASGGPALSALPSHLYVTSGNLHSKLAGSAIFRVDVARVGRESNGLHQGLALQPAPFPAGLQRCVAVRSGSAAGHTKGTQAAVYRGSCGTLLPRLRGLTSQVAARTAPARLSGGQALLLALRNGR